MRFLVRNFRYKNPACAAARLSGLYRLVFCFVAAAGFSACNVTKHLEKEKGGPLLSKNAIELKTEKPLPLDQRTPLLYELGSLYRQKPNERSILAFGTPARLWFYFKYRNRNSKLSRWIMKKIAEPPSYFDEQLSIRTATNLKNYMRQRGYFEAECTYSVKFHNKRFLGLFRLQRDT
ncbi:MAG: hypothetical protein JNK89_11545, partial [Saprospiraceae bacterium]|nr:hypothetical protein [Saprospiraceae bacterium]